jgi:adenosine deaminase
MASVGSVALEFCHLLPKVELHAHLHGSIRDSTILELLQKENYKVDLDVFHVNSNGSRSLAKFVSLPSFISYIN